MSNAVGALQTPNTVSRLPEHTAIGGVHTFSIVPAPSGEQYFGYAGPLMDGPVDMFVSEDLQTWRPYADNPILHRPGLRWPSVVCYDGTYYMAIRSESHPGHSIGTACTRAALRPAANNRALFGLTRIKRKFRPTVPTSISLYKSDDGVNFNFERLLVEPYEHGNLRNQNPFLFKDPNTGHVGLLYYSGDEQEWTIRHRYFNALDGVDASGDVCLLSSQTLLAAPAVFYHPYESQYYLFAEAVDDQSGDWVTVLIRCDDLTSRLRSPTVETVFEDDEACPFPFVNNQYVYLFLSKRHRAGLFPYWEGQIHRYEL